MNAHRIKYPTLVSNLPGEPEVKHFRWWIRFGLLMGTLMATDTPKGWGWNPSVLTLCLIVAGLIAGGAYYLGHQAAIIENLEQKQIETRGVADDASKKSLYAISKVDGGDGHAEPKPSPKAKTKGE